MSWYKNKEVVSWALYDWANSAFATTVMAGFFPVFFKEFCNPQTAAEVSTLRLGMTNSLAGLIIALSAPLLGAIADSRSLKKRSLFIFTLLGIAATVLLSIVGTGQWFQASLLYGIGVIGFSGAIVFYDSFLPQVSRKYSADAVSSLGYSLGYLGGGLLFCLNVLMFLYPQRFGLQDGTAAIKISFISVGLWWALFSLPVFFFVKEESGVREKTSLSMLLGNALRKLGQTLRKLKGMRHVWMFLLAYWLYIDAVNSVIKMAVDYGVSLGFDASALVSSLLITQFVGFPSALVFGYLGQRWGTQRSILLGIFVYCLVTVWASTMSDVREFYLLAVVIGLVQGGVQALSRSFYSDMVPEAESAEFFSFFNLVSKFATIIGPGLIGLITYLSGSARIGILSLLLLFISGAFLLRKVRVQA